MLLFICVTLELPHLIFCGCSLNGQSAGLPHPMSGFNSRHPHCYFFWAVSVNWQHVGPANRKIGFKSRTVHNVGFRVQGSRFRVFEHLFFFVLFVLAVLFVLSLENPEPGTRNPEPGTRNPESGTRNPEPCFLWRNSMVECRSVKPEAGGSSPSATASFGPVAYIGKAPAL